MIQVAALYVATGGCYFGVPGVGPWDENRDARQYAGPWPVVAHPPCQRWGRYWHGGPSVKVRKLKGDDAGCFAAALAAVRTFGGVLEHPEASHAWGHFGITRPDPKGGWKRTACDGWTCQVEQGHYGHKARKATWLYVVGPRPQDLIWGPCGTRTRLDQGYHSAEERRTAIAAGTHKPVERLSKQERIATPLPFRDLLLAIAQRSSTRLATSEGLTSAR